MTDGDFTRGDGSERAPDACPKFSGLFGGLSARTIEADRSSIQADGKLRQGDISRPQEGAPISSQTDTSFDQADTSFDETQLEHLASCPSCRLRLADLDPTRLFALLALERKEESFFLGFETRVMARIRESERQPRPLLRLLGARTYALVGGMALIAAAALVVVEIGPRIPGPGSGQGPGPIAELEDQSGSRTVPPDGGRGVPQDGPASQGGSDPQGGSSRMLRLPTELRAKAPAAVESIDSTTAQIISIKVGEKEQGESDVVLIVDQGMDI